MPLAGGLVNGCQRLARGGHQLVEGGAYGPAMPTLTTALAARCPPFCRRHDEQDADPGVRVRVHEGRRCPVAGYGPGELRPAGGHVALTAADEVRDGRPRQLAPMRIEVRLPGCDGHQLEADQARALAAALLEHADQLDQLRE